jgi:predicted RNA-binding Zn-ribbon protein involved in translation (DUF1610 family)/uncharacterized Zn finger protein (UPF0148 family)
MAYPPRQLWALALASVLHELNGAHHDELGGWGLNPNTRPWCANTLRDFYGVSSKEEFESTAQWLSTEGHTAAARSVLASLGPDPAADDPKQRVVRANRAEIERAGLTAWDLGRLVAVTGWAAWAGYVDEERAWRILLLCAARAQQAYGSWEAYGRGYELGRLFWSGGAAHDGTARALDKLLRDPSSPWRTLPWGLDLGVQMVAGPGAPAPAKQRFKRSVCPTCGAPKTRPSQTAYVYCDYCGALADYDFQKACERPAEAPGPTYQALHASLQPELADAQARGDVHRYRATQQRLFDAMVDASPQAMPPRTKDPAYRAAWVRYMAEAATVAAFDAHARALEQQLHGAIGQLAFVHAGGKLSVAPQAFDRMMHAFLQQQARHHELNAQHGVYALQPDGASPELQQRIGHTLFLQGWLPYLDEQRTQSLVAHFRLGGEYVEAEPPPGDDAACGCCGAPMRAAQGAKRVVCEHCGHRVEAGAAKVACRGCGAALLPEEGQARFSCPHCRAELVRVAPAPS